MKKLILIFTMVCASQLYGMEELIENFKNQEMGKWKLGLKELTVYISVINKRFPNATREEIAIKFNIPIAREYLIVNNKLENAIQLTNPNDRLTHVVNLLGQGADPNFTWGKSGSYKSILGEAYRMALVGTNDIGRVVVEVLLQAEANPKVRYMDTTLIDFAKAINDDKGLFDLLKQYAP